MFESFKDKANAFLSGFKKSRRTKFDRKVLRKNNISLLILDERWNSLFKNTEKKTEILECEEKLRDLLKQQSRLLVEQKEIVALKKSRVDRIIQLTPEVFDKNNKEAKKEMDDCEQEIKRINERLVEIEQGLESIPESINEANLELLELTVNIVYYKIRLNQKKIKELESLIEETTAKLRAYIEEKGNLSEDDDDIYSYFHDLLGAQELERLDEEFFDT